MSSFTALEATTNVTTGPLACPGCGDTIFVGTRKDTGRAIRPGETISCPLCGHVGRIPEDAPHGTIDLDKLAREAARDG